MAYSRPPAKATGDVFDLTAYNSIRDSLIAGIDVVTTKGDLMVATAADTVTRVGVGANDSTLVADSGESAGMVWQLQPHVALSNSAVYDPGTSAWEAVTWDTEDADTDGMHSTVTNTARITVPSGGAGVYLVIATIEFDTTSLSPGTSGEYGVRLLYNGTTPVRTVFDEAEGKAGADISMQVMGMLGLSVTDYVTAQVYTSQNINVTTNSVFEALWQRRS